MDNTLLLRIKLLRTLFSNLTNRFTDPKAVLSINICLQALDDIIGPMRSSVVSRNNVNDFKSSIDFFLLRGDSYDAAYEFAFPNICEILNIQYDKLKPLLDDILPKIEESLDKKAKR